MNKYAKWASGFKSIILLPSSFWGSSRWKYDDLLRGSLTHQPVTKIRFKMKRWSWVIVERYNGVKFNHINEILLNLIVIYNLKKIYDNDAQTVSFSCAQWTITVKTNPPTLKRSIRTREDVCCLFSQQNKPLCTPIMQRRSLNLKLVNKPEVLVGSSFKVHRGEWPPVRKGP